jgi:hypothetical protein
VNPFHCVASHLHPHERQQLAVQVLSKQEPVSHLAQEKQVSRKFLYQQKRIAEGALNRAFEKKSQEKEVLYYLPITQQWIFQLINFIIEELQLREDKAHKGIKALKTALSNQKLDLLAFAKVLDEKLADIAHKFQISLSKVRQVCLLMKKSLSTNVYWQKWNQLYKQLKAKFLPVTEAVESAMKSTPRASSLVENLNSRLRNYFFLRKHLNSDYLDLLRFFLNHRTFIESRVPERVGKSPTELMTGEKHPHWLEMLGFELFQRA